MATVRRDDLDIYYERSGEGPRLLLLNGSGGSIAGSRALIDVLARHFDVVVHDQRGLGRTGLARSGRYSMALYAEDAVAVLDELGWSQSNILGVSFGGMVALEMAASYGDRIAKLVVACTSPGGAGGSSYPLHQLAERDPLERAAIARNNLDTRFDDEWLANHPKDRSLYEFMSAAGPEKSPDTLEGERRQLEARSHHDVWDRLGAITNETLIMAGRYDVTAPLSNSEAMLSRLPKAELRVYEGGHAFLFQDRSAFGDLVTFVSGNS